jgi:hypothetical protein
MCADSGVTDAETATDGLAVEALGDEHRDLQFPRSQHVGRRAHARLVGADRIAALLDRDESDDPNCVGRVARVFRDEVARVPVDAEPGD